MTRRGTAFLLALTLCGAPLAPIFAARASACAHCSGAARCCCAPNKGGAGCGLARPCGSPDDAAPGAQDDAKAVITTSSPAAAPARPSMSFAREACARPVDPTSVPPDPPPRSTS